MIYDCFMFCDELDILKLRLEYLYDVVDYFVIAESNHTHTGDPKPLVFAENKELFEKYLGKILYVEIPRMPGEGGAWDVEHFQRNYLKTALLNCQDDDIVVISDLDEILNIRHILETNEISRPTLVSINFFYYYFNVIHTDQIWNLALISRYEHIRDVDVGDRDTYPALFGEAIHDTIRENGWHFSYLFAGKIDRYRDKVRAFAHQEYNRPYYLLKTRIRYCIDHQLDIFERDFHLNRVNIDDYLDSNLVEKIKKIGLFDEYVLKGKGRSDFRPSNVFFYIYYNLGIRDVVFGVYRFIKNLGVSNHASR